MEDFRKNVIPSTFRNPEARALRKLSYDLIKTYKAINKVHYERKEQKEQERVGNASPSAGEMADTYPEELESNPFVKSLYEEAIKTGKEIDNTIRVNVVGNYAQGKTTLVKRLSGQSVVDVASTNSVEINRCKFNQAILEPCLSFVCHSGHHVSDVDVINRVVSVIRLNEEANSVETESPSPLLFIEQQAHSIDIIQPKVIYTPSTVTPVDMTTNQTTLTGLIDGDKSTATQRNDSEGQKRPLFTSKEMQTFSKKLKLNEGVCDLPTSAFDLWDFGGQYIFYATHTMFHSRKAIYLFVLSLSSTLDEIVRDEEFPWETGEKNMEYFVKFWMNSIHSFVGSDDGYSPPVYLVGTHYDKAGEDSESKKKKSDMYFEQIRGLFDDTKLINHIQSVDFRVDNTNSNDPEIYALRQEIIQMGRKLSHTAVIPAKWLPLERRLKEKSEMKIISFQQVLEVDSENEFPVGDGEQMKLFLTYHHAKGTFFYFDEEPISNYIVIDPQYVIDAFKCIMTSQRFCRNEPELRQLWNRLRKDARLERELIDKVWASDESKEFGKHSEVLLQFLQRHHILSEELRV